MNGKQNNLLDRRALIGSMAKSLLGVSAISLLPRASFAGDAIALDQAAADSQSHGRAFGKAKSVIYIFLTGGMSQIDSFDPKPGTDGQGPVESLPSNADGVQVSEFFPQMARQMDKVCAVRSMNSTQGVHEHGAYYLRTSYEMIQTIQHPGLGAWGSYFLGAEQSSLPPNIKIGGSNSNSYWGGFLDPKHAALPISSPAFGLQNSSIPKNITGDRFARRLERLNALNQKFASQNSTRSVNSHVKLFDEAVRLMNCKDIEGFDLSRESRSSRERYGDTMLGQGCLLAKRLVERGVRFVEVNDRGWDTHLRNFVRMKDKGNQLDCALSSLLQDLSSSGLLDNTLVVVATEFGRTPTIDLANAGRDHYPQAFTCLLAGGGIQGGRSYGQTDEEGHEIIEDLVTVPDFNATIAHAMGLPLEKKVVSPTKRPFTVANKGAPIKELFI